MRADDRTHLAVPTDESPIPDSKILVWNSIEWSKDVEMGSISLLQQNNFHFPIWLSYLLVVEGPLPCWMILMLSAERFVAPGFRLISYKLTDSSCWLEGVVCSLQDVEGGFC